MTDPLEPYQQAFREATAALYAFDTNTLTTSGGKPDETPSRPSLNSSLRVALTRGRPTLRAESGARDMAWWHEFEASDPEFAARIHRIFEANLHKTMATLRRDGSPRISGTEATFAEGELWLGMPRASRKAQDLARDERVAIHSAPLDLTMVEGDAKASGRAVSECNQDLLKRAFGARPPGALFFKLDIAELVLTRVEGNSLVVEYWREGSGLTVLQPA